MSRSFWFTALILPGLVLMGGCASMNTYPIYLHPTIDEVVLSSIQPNDHVNPAVTVGSTMTDPFNWTIVNPLGIPHIYSFPLSSTFDSVVVDYFHNRFPATAQANAARPDAPKIDVKLSSFTVSSPGWDPSGKYLADTTMAVMVNVTKDGKTLPGKLIQVTNQTAGYIQDMTTLPAIFEPAVDKTNAKAILLLDKYLTSIGL